MISWKLSTLGFPDRNPTHSVACGATFPLARAYFLNNQRKLFLKVNNQRADVESERGRPNNRPTSNFSRPWLAPHFRASERFWDRRVFLVRQPKKSWCHFAVDHIGLVPAEVFGALEFTSYFHVLQQSYVTLSPSSAAKSSNVFFSKRSLGLELQWKAIVPSRE